MRWLLVPLSVVALLTGFGTFWLFIDDAQRLHGDALSGREDGGRFLVAQHGREAEVSEADWRWNKKLGVVALTTFPFGVLASVYLIIGVALPSFAFGATAEEREKRFREILASGPAAASGTCGGSIGWVGLGGPMIRVAVHPAGLAIRIRMMGDVGLRRTDVKSVRETRQLWQPLLVLEHGSTHLKGTFALHRPKDAALAQALLELAPRLTPSS